MRNVALLCGGLAIVSSIISVNLWRELRSERLANQELRTQLAAQPAPPPASFDLPMAALPGGAPAAMRRAPPTATASSTAPVTERPERVPPTVSSLVIQQRDLYKDPEYRRAALAQMRLTLPQAYPGLTEELGLSADQADRLFELLADLQLEQNSLAPPLMENGQPPDLAAMEEFSRRSQEMQQRRNDQVAALLGPAGHEQFMAFEQTRGARVQAQSIQRMMESAGAPLTSAQMRPLVDVFVAEQRRQNEQMTSLMRQYASQGQSGSARIQELRLEQQAERNRRLVDAARPHVTAQQLQRLESTLEQQLAMSRVSARMARERAEAQAAAGGPAPATAIQFTPAIISVPN